MDGENNGKPYEQMDDLGGNTLYFWKRPYRFIQDAVQKHCKELNKEPTCDHFGDV